MVEPFQQTQARGLNLAAATPAAVTGGAAGATDLPSVSAPPRCATPVAANAVAFGRCVPSPGKKSAIFAKPQLGAQLASKRWQIGDPPAAAEHPWPSDYPWCTMPQTTEMPITVDGDSGASHSSSRSPGSAEQKWVSKQMAAMRTAERRAVADGYRGATRVQWAGGRRW